MNGPITLVITNLSPAAEQALILLLGSLGPADVSLGGQSQGVPREATLPRLEELWMGDDLVYECADAVGVTRNLASRTVQQVRVAIRHSLERTPRGRLLAPEFASARLSDGTSGRVNAADFVALATNDRALSSLRANSDSEHPFGPAATDAAKAMAGYLEATFGHLD